MKNGMRRLRASSHGWRKETGHHPCEYSKNDVRTENEKIRRHRECFRDAGGLGKCGAPSLFRSSDFLFWQDLFPFLVSGGGEGLRDLIQIKGPRVAGFFFAHALMGPVGPGSLSSPIISRSVAI